MITNQLAGDEPGSSSVVSQLAGALLSFTVATLLLFLLFYFVPNTKVRSRSALLGSVVGAFSLIILFNVFKMIVSRMVSYSVIYGSLASLFFVLLFLYVCWYIILTSAEIIYVHQFRPDKTLLLGNSQSPSRQVSEAVNALLLISDKYRRGDGAMGQKELVRRLAIPSARLSAYLSDFEDARMIMAVNTQRTLFAPARPLDQIKLGDVMRVLYGGVADEDSIETIGEAVATDFFRSGTDSLENVTVENLLERI